jgi:hypothetical protein
MIEAEVSGTSIGAGAPIVIREMQGVGLQSASRRELNYLTSIFTSFDGGR